MIPLRIVFMGTPEFAVPSLKILIEHEINVVAVVTAPDKPKGRGKKIAGSPIKKLAMEHNIPVLQPTNLKSKDFMETLKSFNANLQVVVAFRMLPEVVWNMPELGTFNLHASLLPQYRGAAPINWAIINGEKETGVTTFFIKHAIDTGNILFQEKEPIFNDDTAGSLYERLMHKGAKLVLKTVQAISDQTFTETPQLYTTLLKNAPKIFKETCEINWNKPAYEIYNFVRGLSPYPTAWSIIDGKKFKIFKVKEVSKAKTTHKPGEYFTDNHHYLYFQTGDYLLSIEELQLEGKNKMPIEAFLRGNTLEKEIHYFNF